MQVCFDSKYKIKGCVIQDYLLEQSRITTQSSEERNYHVFYQLSSAASRDKELADRFMLKPAETYNYLNQSGCIRLDGVDDAIKFDSLRLAFEVVQIPAPMIEGILSIVSSIMWLGNLAFTEHDTDGREAAALASDDHIILETVAKLMGLDYEQLKQVL